MGNYSGLNVSIEDVEFLNGKKISRPNESKKRDTAKMLVNIKGPHLELLGGRGNSLHTALVVGRGRKQLTLKGA